MVQFEPTCNQSAEEQEELFKALVETAQAKQHTNFEYIRNVSEWRLMLASRTGLTKVIELFDTVSKSLMREYCKQVRKGVDNFDMLCAYHRYRACKTFYEIELKTAKDMNKEYWAYVDAGHFLDQFLFGRQRASEDLYDFRKRGI